MGRHKPQLIAAAKKAQKDQDIIHTLMGNDVSIRKEFIISNAIDINNLDV